MLSSNTSAPWNGSVTKSDLENNNEQTWTSVYTLCSLINIFFSTALNDNVTFNTNYTDCLTYKIILNILILSTTTHKTNSADNLLEFA